MTVSVGAETPVSASGLVRRTDSGWHWTDSQLTTLCGLRNSGLTFLQIAKAMGSSRSAIAGQLRRLWLDGDKRLSVAVGVRERRGTGQRRFALPDDFEEVAVGKSERALAVHYGVGRTTIGRWRKSLEMTGAVRTFAVPEGFEQIAPTASVYTLASYYGVHHRAVRRWCKETGVQARRAVASFVGRGNRIPPAPRVHRELSRAGDAAEFLRRYGPLYRCHQSGAADAKGQFWSRSGFVLTDDEIIERAERLGWDPQAWRRVA